MAVNQGTKVRPILNISQPENSSFNDNVDEFELEKVKMCTAKSFSHAILAAGKNSIMYKSDVKDAYKLVPAKLEDLRLQGFAFMDMIRVVDPYSFFTDPDPDPEFDVGDQYGSGSGSNPIRIQGFNDQKF